MEENPGHLFKAAVLNTICLKMNIMFFIKSVKKSTPILE